MKNLPKMDNPPPVPSAQHMPARLFRVVLRQDIIGWDGKRTNLTIDCSGWNKHANGSFIVLYNPENRQIHVNQNNILSITEIECDGKG